MKDLMSITQPQCDEVIRYFVENPEFTVGEAMEKFKITKETSFYLMKEASKQLPL